MADTIIEQTFAINPCRHCGYTPEYFTELELKIRNPPPNLYQIICRCGMSTKCDQSKEKVILIWNGTRENG